MKARVYVEYTQDEVVREIPYMLVAETFERKRHKTFTGKRIFKEMFITQGERSKVREMVRQAKIWALGTGVPLGGVRMTVDTWSMWQRLADYCMRVG